MGPALLLNIAIAAGPVAKPTKLPTRKLDRDAAGFRVAQAPAARAAPVRSNARDGFHPRAQREIVPQGARLEVLWNEGQFTEGPALSPDGAILFSDIGNTIYRFDPQSGKTTVFRRNSGRANGLMFDQQGRLLACEGANTGGRRRVSITEPDGTVRTLTDRYRGKRLNSPNDLAIDPQGRVYFTDPRYVGTEPRELDFEGVFLVDRDGTTRLATRDVQKPNGILVSIDGRRVYLADHDPRGKRQLLVFDVQKDGSLAHKRVLYDFGESRGPDGMTLDRQGNIYAAAGRGDEAGIYVFGPDGRHLAFIRTPAAPTNCVFGGGSDPRSLYITAGVPKSERPASGRRAALYRIRLAHEGYHVVPLK